MKEKINWQFNEFAQVGKDYSDLQEVEAFDKRHSDFRDIEGASNEVLDALEVGRDDVLIDFGSGTGTFAVQAALRCQTVHAVDVSQAMLDYSRIKVEKAGVNNIEFHHCGCLDYECADSSVDFITTTLVLHHLPDFWKRIALQRMFRMLKPGGRFYINDAIIAEENAIENICVFIDKLETVGGRNMREDVEEHFRAEYSTYDWIMDGLLTGAGFTIDSKRIDDGVLGTYYCTK